MSKMRNVKKMREILRLKFESQLSNRHIGKIVNTSPGIVSIYTSLFRQQELEWTQLQKKTDDELLEIFYDMNNFSVSKKRAFIEPDFKKIHQELKLKTVTLQLLWEEYRDTYGEKAYSRTQFCKMYKSWCNKLKTTMRQIHKAGDKLFIDYAGSTVPIIDSHSGEIKNAQIFVAVLGASNYTYAEATWTQTLPDWVGSHVRAFNYFKGVPALLIPDNLRSATTKSCRYEPEINSTYSDMARHYNTAVLPARPRKPRDKATAEVGVQIIGRFILAKLRHQNFFTLFELNQAIAKLLIELNLKPFQKLSGSRTSQFEAIDKPALKPLPDTPYVYSEFKKVQLGFDYHIEIDGHYYSAPYELTKESIEVRITANIIEIFNKGTRIASHIRSYRRGAHTTVQEHMPKKHQKHMRWTPERFLNWANSIGPKTFHLTKHIIEIKKHPEQAYRVCLGLLNLCKLYSKERLEAACNRAIHYHAFTRRSVAEILKNGLDKQLLIETQSESKVTKHHKNIRGPEYFTKIKLKEDIEC
ncbi:MAG TPA: IS21 family transposase [Gammaproteobacteria bacterium]|nr:IS21 family transposase [Gammaproteobacteria bacterium]